MEELVSSLVFSFHQNVLAEVTCEDAKMAQLTLLSQQL